VVPRNNDIAVDGALVVSGKDTNLVQTMDVVV
jgi:hypothetical protein